MPRSEIYFSICFVGSKSSKSSRVFGGYGGSDIIVHGLLVAKVAKCIFRKNNVFTLVFDLSVAEVAGFSGVRGIAYNNAFSWFVGSKRTKVHVL